MISPIESPVSPEKKERGSKVTLHFFRHGEKLKDPSKTNQAFELTEKGREQAIKKSVAEIKGFLNSTLLQYLFTAFPTKEDKHTLFLDYLSFYAIFKNIK